MTEKVNVSSEVCIWKALKENRTVSDLEKATVKIAKQEYGVSIVHRKFQNGFENLEKSGMIVFTKPDKRSKIYQRNQKAAKRDVQLLEMIGDEYRVIRNIREQNEQFEAKLEEFQALNDEDKKLTQLAVTNKKEMLLVRIKWLTLIQCEGDCPKFLESEIATQKDHAVVLLTAIHRNLKKLDKRLAAESSAKIWKISIKEINKIADEYEKLDEYYSKR